MCYWLAEIPQNNREWYYNLLECITFSFQILAHQISALFTFTYGWIAHLQSKSLFPFPSFQIPHGKYCCINPVVIGRSIDVRVCSATGLCWSGLTSWLSLQPHKPSQTKSNWHAVRLTKMLYELA